MICGYIIGKLYNNCEVNIQDTRSLSYHRVLETWGTRVPKHERMVGSALQVMTYLSGWLHQVITQGLWAPPAHSPNSPYSPNPSTTNRSLDHFGHISATFPTIFPFFCSIEQRKCISRYHWVSSFICDSLRETSSSATFQQVMSLVFKGTINRRSSSSSGSSNGKDCYRAIKRQATSKH